MPPTQFTIDANLLVLLIVGSVRRDQVSAHRRTTNYDPEAFDVLSHVLEGADRLWVTPNVLTEASNLLRINGSEASAPYAQALRVLVDTVVEVYVPSRNAVGRAEFGWLGVTDAGLLEAASSERPLLTDDSALHSAVLSVDPVGAVNFRELYVRD